jgi:hypothetical protein
LQARLSRRRRRARRHQGDPPAATPAPSSEPAPPAPSPAPTSAPAPAPSGDARGALRASRQQEKRLRGEIDRLKQENEALKKGQPDPESIDLTADELEDLRVNFPAQYKVAMMTKQLRDNQQQQRELEEHDSDGFQPPQYAPEIQLVIDQVPELLSWQFDEASQNKFARAIEHDKALLTDPDWKTKPAVERFAEAARRTRAAFETNAPAPAPTTAPAPAPAGTRTDPAKVIADAPTDGPKGLSDLRGGGPANAPALDFNKLTDADIMASLRPED